MNYEIGQKYKYPRSKKVFELIHVKGFIFKFKCGHWCTDNVFIDLINCKTGIQVCKDKQLKLKL